MRLVDIDSPFITSLFPDHHPDYQTFNLDDAYDRGWEDALGNLEDASIVNPVHAAGGCYCRECIHYREHRTNRYKQLIRECVRMAKDDMEFRVKPDDFCSYGKKKEEDHEVS